MQYKTILIGDMSVGKTSLAHRIVYKTFNLNGSSTIGAAFSRYRDKETKIIFDIWDTAGQERFKSLVPMYLRDAKIVLLVYDANSETSFESLMYWTNQLNITHCFPLVVVIIRNKKDLQKNKLSWDKGEEIANKSEWLYMESSAKNDKTILPNYSEGSVVDILKYIAKSLKNNHNLKLNNRKEENMISRNLVNDDSFCSC